MHFLDILENVFRFYFELYIARIMKVKFNVIRTKYVINAIQAINLFKIYLRLIIFREDSDNTPYRQHTKLYASSTNQNE